MVSLCFNSLHLSPPSSHPPPRKLTASASLSSVALTTGAPALKPIVVTGNPPTFVSAPGRRIVAVGDLHGDLDKARRAFQLAGVLGVDDGQDLWIGEDAIFCRNFNFPFFL